MKRRGFKEICYIFLLIVLFVPSGNVFSVSRDVAPRIKVCNATTTTCLEPEVSTTTATTTATEATTTPTREEGGGILNDTRIANFYVNLVSDTGVIKFESNKDVRYVVFYGETKDLGNEVVYSGEYLKDHTIFLPDLKYDTVYYYKIEVIDKNNNRAVTNIKTFETAPLSAVLYPSAPNYFLGKVIEDGVALSWSLPVLPGNNFFTRVVRSDRGYPGDIYDGVPIFEGGGESFLDKIGLEQGKKYYYSAFICSTSGVCSSPAVFSVVFEKISATSGPQASEYTEPPSIPPLIHNVFDKILFFRNNVRFLEKEGVFFITSADDLSVKMSVLPGNSGAERASVLFRDKKLPSNIFIYLAKYNRTNGYYETSGFRVPAGDYEVRVEADNFQNRLVDLRIFSLYVEEAAEGAIGGCFKDWWSFVLCLWPYFVAILFAVGAFILRHFLRR